MKITATSVMQARHYRRYLDAMQVQYTLWAKGDWTTKDGPVFLRGPTEILALHTNREEVLLELDNWSEWMRPEEGKEISVVFSCQ